LRCDFDAVALDCLDQRDAEMKLARFELADPRETDLGGLRLGAVWVF
jgi:hypothetical protein